MKASLLVEQLQKRIREDGDQEVLILSDGRSDTLHSVGTFDDENSDQHYISLVTDAFYDAFDSGFRKETVRDFQTDKCKYRRQDERYFRPRRSSMRSCVVTVFLVVVLALMAVLGWFLGSWLKW